MLEGCVLDVLSFSKIWSLCNLDKFASFRVSSWLAKKKATCKCYFMCLSNVLYWIKKNNWIWSELHISSYFYIPYHSIRSRQCGFLSCLQFHFAELNFPLISPLISVLAVCPSCDQPIGHASSTVISLDDLPTQTRSKHGKPVIRKCEMTLDHVMIMLDVLKISLCITDDNQGNVWQALIACPSVSTWRDRTFSSKCSQQR